MYFSFIGELLSIQKFLPSRDIVEQLIIAVESENKNIKVRIPANISLLRLTPNLLEKPSTPSEQAIMEITIISSGERMVFDTNADDSA